MQARLHSSLFQRSPTPSTVSEKVRRPSDRLLTRFWIEGGGAFRGLFLPPPDQGGLGSSPAPVRFILRAREHAALRVRDVFRDSAGQRFLAAEHFAAARDVIMGRCAMCHTAEPVYEGVLQAPKNVHLDSDAAIANHAHEVAMQAGFSHAMPPGNVTEMTADERALIVQWFREAGG